MNCPICDDVQLLEVEKAGVSIDTCPNCKGVWLDRGELDKLLQSVRDMKEELDEMDRSKDGVPTAAPGAEYGSVEPGLQVSQNFGGPGQVYSHPIEQEPDLQASPSAPPGYTAGGQPVSADATPFGAQPEYYSGKDKADHGIKQGYDKHGYPYKKKRSVLDVLGDLFE